MKLQNDGTNKSEGNKRESAKKKSYTGKVKAVIFDWAGTTVDFGCFAPLVAVEEIFKSYDIIPTMKEIRKFMGLSKIEHITKMLKLRRIKRLWKEKYKKKPTKEDIQTLYNKFEESLLKILPDYAEPIARVVNVVNKLKSKNIKIGTTTGYTSEMMDIIAPIARKKGYEPDSIVTSTDVPKGRPSPLMCYQNLINMNVHPVEAVVKVGDTLADIKEGLNAGMWSVGVVLGSSVLGLSIDELKNLNDRKLKKKMRKAKRKFKREGAHYVMVSMDEIFDVIKDVESKLSKGLTPVRK